MARRITGRYSPGAPQDARRPVPAGSRPPARWTGKRPTRVNARVNVLFLAAAPFAAAAFFGSPTGMLLNLGAFAMLLLSAWLTREGVRAEEAYDARKVAKRPAMPRKIFGSILMGAGLALGGYATNTLDAAIFAILGAGLHFASFGPDPLTDKGIEGMDSFQTDRVARAVDEAEKHLADMSAAIRPLGDRHLVARLEAFQANAREMFRAVESDPRSLTAARRYLGVYLLGARDATAKFADLYTRTRDTTARTDYEALLGDLEANFSTRTEALLANDRTALDIEVEVLRERLAREGVRPEQDPA